MIERHPEVVASVSPKRSTMAPGEHNGATATIILVIIFPRSFKTKTHKKHMAILAAAMIHWHVGRNIQGPISIGDDPNPALCPGLPQGHPGCLMPTYSTTLSHTVKSRSDFKQTNIFGATRLMVTSRTVTSRPHDCVLTKYLLVFHFVLAIEQC